MKSTKDFRTTGERFYAEDSRRGTKLAPAKKSGKERISLYDEEEDEELLSAPKKESVLDYFDDNEEEL